MLLGRALSRHRPGRGSRASSARWLVVRGRANDPRGAGTASSYRPRSASGRHERVEAPRPVGCRLRLAGWRGRAGAPGCARRRVGGAFVLPDHHRPAPGRVLAVVDLPMVRGAAPLRARPSRRHPQRRDGGPVVRRSGRRWWRLRGGRHSAGRGVPERAVPETPNARLPGVAVMPGPADRADDLPAVWCVRCGVPIRRWRTGRWLHVGPRGTFWCRDRLGLVTEYLAAPPMQATGPAVESVPVVPGSRGDAR